MLLTFKKEGKRERFKKKLKSLKIYPSLIGFHTKIKDVVCVSGLVNWIAVSFNSYFKTKRTKTKPTLVLYMLLTPNSQAMFPSELKRNIQILRKALYIWNGS